MLESLKDKTICEEANVDFEPPRIDQLVSISEGVLEGMSVEGIRYPSPDHMSGWWLVTDKYSGDVKDMKPHHLSHIIEARPELAGFLSLPYGFRFTTKPRAAWFDEEVANRKD